MGTLYYGECWRTTNGCDWIGIDVNQLPIPRIKNHLQDTSLRRLRFVSGSSAISSPSPPRSGGEGRGEAAQIKSPHPASGHPLTLSPLRGAREKTYRSSASSASTPDKAATGEPFGKAPQAKAPGHEQHELTL